MRTERGRVWVHGTGRHSRVKSRAVEAPVLRLLVGERELHLIEVEGGEQVALHVMDTAFRVPIMLWGPGRARVDKAAVVLRHLGARNVERGSSSACFSTAALALSTTTSLGQPEKNRKALLWQRILVDILWSKTNSTYACREKESVITKA
jgi:hypothetical protein